MEFRILGSLEAAVGGRRLALGSPSEQKVLAILLLAADRLVSVPILVDALWDGGPPATAAKQARNAVSRVRRLLASGGEPAPLLKEGAGYRLVVEDRALDARLFDMMAGKAQAEMAARRVGETAELLRSALGLWRGPVLAGLSGRAIEAAATAWEERRYAAWDVYHDCQLSLGRHREIIAGLSALIADHPLREKQTEQLMLAFYRSGRQSEALQAYARTRDLLASELGLDPGPALRGLHQRILMAEPALNFQPAWCVKEEWTIGWVALLALIAGTVSYLHMHLLVALHGQPGWVAALTPLSVDGMIVAASTMLLADSRAGRRGGMLPWALLVAGSVASLAANVAVAEPTMIGRVIAAWPSFALTASYEVLTRHVRGSATGREGHAGPKRPSQGSRAARPRSGYWGTRAGSRADTRAVQLCSVPICRSGSAAAGLAVGWG
jgi:DNA-binding SARP family transcriptional activator